MRKDVDWAKALSAILGTLKTTTQDSYTILTANIPLLGPQDVSFCVIDARTIVVVQEKDGKFRMPTRSAKCPVNLGPSWSKVERSPFAIGFDNHDGFFTKKLAPEVSDITGMAKLIAAMDSACFDLNFKPGIAGRFFIHGNSEAQAKEIVALIGDLANQAKALLDAKPEKDENPAAVEMARKLTTEILQSGKVEQAGAEVRAEGHTALTLANYLLLQKMSAEAHADVKK
jgi:hypothetical protein